MFLTWSTISLARKILFVVVVDDVVQAVLHRPQAVDADERPDGQHGQDNAESKGESCPQFHV